MVPLPPSRRPRFHVFLAATACLAGALALTPTPTLAAEDSAMAEAFDAFTRIGLDTSRSLPVSNLKIERDGMVLELSSGRLWLAQPIRDRITGAHFVGQGVVTLTSNGLTGLNMLRATLKGQNAGVSFPGKLPADAVLRPASGEKDFDIFKAKVSEVYLRFSDGLEEQLVPLLQDGGGDGAAADKSFGDRNTKLFYAPLTLQIPFLLEVENGIDRFPFFVAEFAIGPEWLTYANVDLAPTEIWIGTHPTVGAGVTQRVFTWTAFDRKEDHDQKGHWDADLLLDQKTLLDITKIEMTVDLPNTLAFTIDAKVTFSSLADELKVVPFDLINNYGYGWWEKGGRPVTLKSVTDEQGNDLPFMHKANALFVRLAQPLPPGQPTTLRFVAEEQTIIQITDQSWNIVNTYPWFPQHGYVGGQYALDWTIKVKKPLSAIASGTLVEEKEEAGQQITRWKLDKEVAFPSLIFGRFQTREDTYKSEVTGKEIKVGVHANPMGDLRGTTKSKSVAEEAMVILKLLEALYGPYPYDRIDITQMATGMGFGQAPPGILFLTGEAFLPTGLLAAFSGARGPYFHDFFAHELGHQWWGHKVLWGRDEDQWLSEAFTEYASALYVLQIDGMGKFQEKLRAWQDGAKIGERSGFPIAAANYASASDPAVAGNYRTNLIYNKGAYVVHMLRMTIGHEKFVEGMQSFLKRYDGRMATTSMLKEVVEEVTGGSMDWFFDQWFYSTGTPTFRFSYQTQKTEDGSYLLTGRIVQDPDDYKQVLMPVFYELGGKQPSIQNVAVGTADFTFKAKLPVEPKRVWLDEFNTVLGDKVLEKK